MTLSEKVRPLACGLGASLADALRAIDATGAGVVFVVGDGDVLLGLLTDGDIRRAFLSGAGLTDLVDQHMNREPTAGFATSARADNLALMSDRIRHLPLVDGTRRLVDYLSWREGWPMPLVSPSFGGNELRYVEDCLRSGWISSRGGYIARFEEAVAGFIGQTHAVSTANGTLALQLALQALDVGQGDEVIVPDFTFGACANAVIQRGARPVFVDVDPVTWTICPAMIERALTPRTKAIMAVHLYGHPCDMDPILAIAQSRGVKVVEDCAEAFGAEYRGRKVGSLGDIACFSFFANKIITTGEGGMCTTADPALADRLRLLRDHGMRPGRRYWHEEPGTNGRMTNLQAAIGLGQMERVDTFLEWRDRLATQYDTALEGIPGIGLRRPMEWARPVTWLYTILVDPVALACERDVLIAHLRERGIESRPTFAALHPQPAFASASTPWPCPVAEQLGSAGLSLPTGDERRHIDVHRVAQEIRNASRRGALAL